MATKSKHIQAGMKVVMDRSGQSHPLKVEVDPGSYCSVIPHPFFDNQFHSLHL